MFGGMSARECASARKARTAHFSAGRAAISVIRKDFSASRSPGRSERTPGMVIIFVCLIAMPLAYDVGDDLGLPRSIMRWQGLSISLKSAHSPARRDKPNGLSRCDVLSGSALTASDHDRGIVGRRKAEGHATRAVALRAHVNLITNPDASTRPAYRAHLEDHLASSPLRFRLAFFRKKIL